MIVTLVLILAFIDAVAYDFMSQCWWTSIVSNPGNIDDTIIVTFRVTSVVFIGIILFMARWVIRYRCREGRAALYEPEKASKDSRR